MGFEKYHDQRVRQIEEPVVSFYPRSGSFALSAGAASEFNIDGDFVKYHPDVKNNVLELEFGDDFDRGERVYSVFQSATTPRFGGANIIKEFGSCVSDLDGIVRCEILSEVDEEVLRIDMSGFD